MPERTLATRLADWVVALDYDQLSRRVAEMAKLLVLEQLGLQIHGATRPAVQPSLRRTAG